VTRSYFDSSAIVKLTHLESESQALIDYLDNNDFEASASILSEVEVLRTLGRVRADPHDAVRGFFLLNLDADVLRAAASLGPPNLRTIDAIHVATALAIGDPKLEFVTYDDRMALAARECGLKVVQPGR
jgi:hypothetical protein